MTEERPARQWEIELCQEAYQLAAPVLDPDEQVLAAARTRSGLPAVLLLPFAPIGGSLWLGILWPSVIGRGIVAVTPTRLVLLNTKKRKIAWAKPLSGLEARFKRRPLLDDKLVLRCDMEEPITVHLAGDWTFLERTLIPLLSAA